MIITCNNCNKKFDVDESLIPEKGRLLQCNGCNHEWFFKKEILNKPTLPIKTSKLTEETVVDNEKVVSLNSENTETIELLDRSIENEHLIEKISIKNDVKENENVDLKANSSKNKKNYNILSLTIIFIISFVAIIIVLDTFQGPIGKIVPNIDFLLYNLYETINDIRLFLKNLI
tara:strand:- start:553 stop:1074 length:522 start_codon:yes stop_codon:yes gene_type:complete